jgi:hypothetical protein
MKHGHTALPSEWTRKVDMYYEQAAWTCSMDMRHAIDMQHGHKAWMSSMDMEHVDMTFSIDMQHVHAAKKWSMDIKDEHKLRNFGFPEI